MTMKNIGKITVIYACLTLLFFSCSEETSDENKENTSTEEVVDSTDVDSLSMDEEVDTSEQADYVSEEDEMEALNEEHQQLSFCDCVKKQEALEKSLDEEEDDEKLMELLDEMERLVNEECKIITTSPNTTPDERAAHKRKVRKCKGA